MTNLELYKHFTMPHNWDNDYRNFIQFCTKVSPTPFSSFVSRTLYFYRQSSDLGRSKDLVQTPSFDNLTMEAIDKICLRYQKGGYWGQHIGETSTHIFANEKKNLMKKYIFYANMFGETHFYFRYSTGQFFFNQKKQPPPRNNLIYIS